MNHSSHFEVVTRILNNWRSASPGWNTKISSNVYLGKTSSIFPIPDSTLIDDDNKYSIAIEFKSVLENKRGALTALGQAISYTQKASLSYLVIPNKIKGYDVEAFMCDLFASKKLNQILPIGLITYNPSTKEPELKFEIEAPLTPTKNIDDFLGTYWATYKDSYPDAIWRLLDIAYLLENTNNRKSQIWDEFYHKYLLPIPDDFWTSATDLDLWLTYPKTYTWEKNTLQQKGKKDIKEFNIKIKDGKLTLKDAKKELKEKYFLNKSSDGPYNQVQKNIFNFMNHLGLFDDYYYLTETGYHLHKIGKLYGSTSEYFKKELAKVTLTQGKHLDLIIEITNLQKKYFDILNSSRSTQDLTLAEFREQILNFIENDFDENGKLKRNPNRKSSGDRSFLKDELTLWGSLGLIIKTKNSYCSPKTGFTFDWDNITSILLDR